MVCKICASKAQKLFTKLVLSKYTVFYYQCFECGFIQTEEPFWLEEAYSSGAISALDTGIIYRNLNLKNRTKGILLFMIKDFSNFIALDFGGGEGIFVRMMRDEGFNFFRQDIYAKNLYARFFDIVDLPKGTRFNVLTAFEVFEHLSDPLIEVNNMLEYSDVLLFSTELQPSKKIEDLENWWYLVPETGQHISFYNHSSLMKMAELLNLNFYTDYKNLHIFSKKELENPFKKNILLNERRGLIGRILNRFNWRLGSNEPPSTVDAPSSLTMVDFESIKEKLNSQETQNK